MKDLLDPKCHCGQPLHYADPKLKRAVEDLIREYGPYIRLSVGNRSWWVQRHFIALHGVRGVELPFLGFQEVIKQ